jgi:AraC-like DNA-binding protein
MSGEKRHREKRRSVGKPTPSVPAHGDTRGVTVAIGRQHPAKRGRRTTDRADKLEAARQYITLNYARAPKLADVAAAAGLSTFFFHRLFTAHFGTTPKAMAAAAQIAEAKRLIMNDVKLSVVAERVGFKGSARLSVRFKQLVGRGPRDWRLEQARAAGGTTEGSGDQPAANRPQSQ